MISQQVHLNCPQCGVKMQVSVQELGDACVAEEDVLQNVLNLPSEKSMPPEVE